MYSVQLYFAEHSDSTPRVPQYNVAKQMLRDFTGYKQWITDGNYVDGIVMSTVILDAWVATVMRCLVEKEIR